jgi:hypothetical protein
MIQPPPVLKPLPLKTNPGYETPEHPYAAERDREIISGPFSFVDYGRTWMLPPSSGRCVVAAPSWYEVPLASHTRIA